jgi:hypothetical protein
MTNVLCNRHLDRVDVVHLAGEGRAGNRIRSERNVDLESQFYNF